MQNVRAVTFRADALLAPPRRPGARPVAAAGAVRALDALRFLGVRLAVIAGSAAANANAPGTRTRIGTAAKAIPAAAPAPLADLEATGLADRFEILHPAAPLVELAAALDLAPADILHTGPALDTDVNAALAAGMRAAWLAPDASFHPKGAVVVLRNLSELPEILRMADTAHLHCKPVSRATRSLVAMLRGVPEDLPLGPGRRHFDPERQIGGLILEVAAKIRAEAGPIEILRDHWLELIPQPKLSAASAPEKVTPTGVLMVHCSDTIVREELSRWHGKRLLSAVTRLPACSKVRKISFHV
jgi:hypothetical protein